MKSIIYQSEKGNKVKGKVIKLQVKFKDNQVEMG